MSVKLKLNKVDDIMDTYVWKFGKNNMNPIILSIPCQNLIRIY